MPQANYEVCLSNPLVKALASSSDATTPLRYFDITGTAPSGDGVVDLAQDGIFTANRLKILPYCDGPAGTMFWLRLWSWNRVPAAVNLDVWVPQLLVELICFAGDNPGPQIPPPMTPRVISQTENLCAALGLSAGSLGDDGELLVTGIGPAAALVEVRGAQKVQFEFQRDEHDRITMNALYARA